MSELGAKLIASVRKFAAERPDYVYRNADDKHPSRSGCVYFTKDGKPSCLIGHALAELGLLDAQPEHPRARCIAARGPFTLEDERALFAAESFDVLVSKNSGGNATEAKLQVARERGLPVLILQRPSLPEVERSFADPDTLWQALQPLL